MIINLTDQGCLNCPWRILMIKRTPWITTFIAILTLSAVSNSLLSADNSTTNRVIKQIDAFFSKKFPADQPGAALLIVKDGNLLLRKGYGMANMELAVPVKPEHVFRIGSITKQFTAAAVMMLKEEGKISLEDEITKYLPNYPVTGNKITIHQLMNHTSGIKSYTSMNKVMDRMRDDFTVTKMIDQFKNEPLDFEPGEKWLYNNSGYFLLGAIIEKISGKTYEAFIRERIFNPLGMKNSYYGDHNRIIPNRITGYAKRVNLLVNDDFLSMTTPYAAGALLSTVDDLWTWTKALHTGKVVSEKSFQLMIEPTKTADGKETKYGYGLDVNPLFGEKQVGHGGGINGFITHALHLPEKNIFVSVLTNCTGSIEPDYMAKWAAAVLCGKDVKDRKAISLDIETMDEIVGVYQINKDETRTITREGNQLYSQRSGGMKQKIFPESKTQFFYKDSFSFFTIHRDKKGNVVKMVMRGSRQDEEAVKTNKKPPGREIVKLDPGIFDSYKGEYVADNGMLMTIKQVDNKYIVAVKSQPEFECFPMSKTEFFLKAIDATLTFEKDSEGMVTGILLKMGPREIKLKKK